MKNLPLSWNIPLSRLKTFPKINKISKCNHCTNETILFIYDIHIWLLIRRAEKESARRFGLGKEEKSSQVADCWRLLTVLIIFLFYLPLRIEINTWIFYIISTMFFNGFYIFRFVSFSYTLYVCDSADGRHHRFILIDIAQPKVSPWCHAEIRTRILFYGKQGLNQ